MSADVGNGGDCMELPRTWRIFRRWTPIAARYLVAWVALHTFHRALLRRELWLIAEKRAEARDNGYALFRYLRTEYPELDAYYVLAADSPDGARVAALGNVLPADSWTHLLYYLAASVSVGSQAGGAFPMQMCPALYRLTRPLRRRGQKCVFLQHGVTASAMPMPELQYAARMHDLFVVTSAREKAFVRRAFGYPDEAVQVLGFCRFDALARGARTERVILYFPTWREWLCGARAEPFCASEYFRRVSAFLRSARLSALLERFDFRLLFYPHPALQPQLAAFAPCVSPRVVLASWREYDVQALLRDCAVLITDFSSVAFDFAYLEKPVLYYQFDTPRYRREHYGAGDFDFRRDGFGPVAETEADALDALERLLAAPGAPAEPYRARERAAFAFHDAQNCARNAAAIRRLVSG